MLRRGMLVLSVALLGTALSSVACAPQVVDAVDGAGATGGSGGSGPSGGTAGSAGGSPCPNGGSEVDRDGDGTPDCRDECPDDPLKDKPVICGCGLSDPDPADAGTPSCLDLASLLVHRYTFDGTDEVVTDSVDRLDGSGTVVNTSLSGQGTLVLLGGQSDQYAGLPNGILSELTSATLEAWVRWNGGSVWQRIFDFGDNLSNVEGQQADNGVSYLFLTARTPLSPADLMTGKLRVAYKRRTDFFEVTVDGDIALPSGVATPTHVAVTIDAVNKTVALYIDGTLQEGVAHFRNNGDPAATSMQGRYDWSVPVAGPDGGLVSPPVVDLSMIRDINNWLGRSQFMADEELNGTFYEFRIYAGALTAEQIAISYEAGPDPKFLP